MKARTELSPFCLSTIIAFSDWGKHFQISRTFSLLFPCLVCCVLRACSAESKVMFSLGKGMLHCKRAGLHSLVLLDPCPVCCIHHSAKDWQLVYQHTTSHGRISSSIHPAIPLFAGGTPQLMCGGSQRSLPGWAPPTSARRVTSFCK